jgi:hypothetical protein
MIFCNYAVELALTADSPIRGFFGKLLGLAAEARRRMAYFSEKG